MRSFVWLDDKSKKLTGLNRNYYFVTTVFIVLLNIILFASCNKPYIAERPNWSSFSVINLVQALINTYWHLNWQHVLLNMLCFFIAGLYLERKKGSLKFFLFIVVMSLFTGFASCTNDVSLGWTGFSGMNYGLYGYILIEYSFVLFQKEKRNLFNIISGAVIVALIYLAMCFNGGTATIGFEWYPYDLLHNLGHASGFVVGLVFGIYEQSCAAIAAYKGSAKKKHKGVVEKKVEEITDVNSEDRQ